MNTARVRRTTAAEEAELCERIRQLEREAIGELRKFFHVPVAA